MGKKIKVGSQRKDKFYHLAKETGYRSRAAFKLIQLNRKFEFLQKSRICIDLCAAPGGWMQVAKENMPLSSMIIGVDLYAIKAIGGCVTLIEDITTEKCRTSLKRELQTWKADVVLHDGAPNMGTNWLHDAYQQSCLTLSALKLAVNVLNKGGWFVSKLFRSKDYNALLWVLKQLFVKVHVTKPQASRNESAEIFLVCENYICPDKIDPKFLDVRYVFQDLDLKNTSNNSVLQPENKKKRKKAEGYPDNDYTLHHQIKASTFVKEFEQFNNDVLANASEIVIDDDDIRSNKLTTIEVLECCKDLKVLGRKDWKRLLKWRQNLYDKLYKPNDSNTKDEEKMMDDKNGNDDDDTLELENIEQEILQLNEEEKQNLRRQKKRAAKERKKLNDRLNLKMVLKGDQGPQLQEDETLFNLDALKACTFNEDTVPDDSQSDEDELEFYSSDESQVEDEKNTLITDCDYRSLEEKRQQKAALWFSRPGFNDLQNETDENPIIYSAQEEEHSKPNNLKVEKRVKQDKDKMKIKAIKLTPEELAMGSVLINSRKSRRDLIDSAWNRYSFNDENLPSWFVEDEQKHMSKPTPIPQETVDEYKKRLQEINTCPIKKVIEAKARKKKRTLRRLEKLKKKATNLLDVEGLTNAERTHQIKQLYKKAKQKPKKDTVYVVAKKHQRGKNMRPPGVKGRYKVVDARLKKDTRKSKVKGVKKSKGFKSKRKT